jgi:hypothetical protein
MDGARQFSLQNQRVLQQVLHLLRSVVERELQQLESGPDFIRCINIRQKSFRTLALLW